MLKNQRELVKVFDMGKYHEISGELDLVIAEKNALQTLKLAQQMLECVDTLQNFRFLPLYEHMKFKETGSKFINELRMNLMKCFRDEDTFDYMGDNREREESTTHKCDTND